MFEYNGVEYELKLNLKRISIIETVMKKSIAEIMNRGGAFSINELMTITSYAMIKVGANAYEQPKKAAAIVEEMLNEAGAYQTLSDLVAEAIERDCPFFFPAA